MESAVAVMISRTVLSVNFGATETINAAAAATCGVAEDVPLNVSVKFVIE